MAKRGGHHRFAARKREQDRKARAEQKRQRKQERAEAKSDGGVDPDIENIVPGPQPKEEVDEAEVQRAVERAMRPGKVAAENRPLSPAKAAACRLFVGNLDRFTDDHLLRQHFKVSGYDAVDTSVVYDRNGDSRGFAFVDMPSPDAARAAAQALDGVSLDGRPLRIRPASDSPPGRR